MQHLVFNDCMGLVKFSLWNDLVWGQLDRILSVNGSQVAEVVSGVPQGSVLGPILFVIYVNDLSYNLTIDHLLYADDVKLIAPRKQSDALHISLLASSKWSED